MWNIISSLVTTSIIYFIMKIINPKNKKATLLLIFLTFLLMSFKVFTQTLIWVTGNITYVFIQNVKYYTDMYGNPDEILTCDGFYVYVYNKNVVAEKFT